MSPGGRERGQREGKGGLVKGRGDKRGAADRYYQMHLVVKDCHVRPAIDKPQRTATYTQGFPL